MRHRVVILYSELADYSIACFRQLASEGAEIVLIHWPVNPEAPFKFDLNFTQQSIDRHTLSDKELLKTIDGFNPDIILCSGWMDKGYMKACRMWTDKIPTVLSMDNRWNGSPKQQLARLVAPFTIRKAFSHAFVPGESQKAYALKLGFKESTISTGFYAANVEKFEDFYQKRKSENGQTIAKRFLYLGRYVEHKGIFEMWDAFKKFKTHYPDWELWCVGTGECYEQRALGEGIRHFGFVQPQDLLPILMDTGVYILPSRFEPWGVSVQEMAIAGFPLMLSDAIGSREAFLDSRNGVVFEAGSSEAIFEAMTKMAQLSEAQKAEMSEHSHAMGMRLTPQTWAKTLLAFCQKSA